MKKLKKLILSKTFFKTSKQLSCTATAGAGMLALAGTAPAQTIIQDSFTSGSHYGTSIDQQTGNSAGIAPTTDIAVPGQKWQHINGAWYDGYESSNSGTNSNYFFAQNVAQFHNDASAGLSIGSYDTGSLALSASIGFNNGAGPVGSNAFALLGYSASLNTASNYGPTATTYYTGLAVLGNGSLQEYVDGTAVGTAEAYGGTFSSYSGSLLKLSYTINTATGAISDVTFGNSTTAYSFAVPTSFSSLDTANLEIGGQAGNNSDTAVITSLDLSAEDAVPEPSSCALLVGGALMLGACARRRSFLS